MEIQWVNKSGINIKKYPRNTLYFYPQLTQEDIYEASL